jgi:TolB-like protein/tetratricopeptide (TPR) repeat protein
MSLITEIKRRNVFKVAVVYAIVAWLIAQVIAVVDEPLRLPDWFDTAIIVLLIVGFPLALLFAWAYELTPAGIKPTKSVAPADSIRQRTGQRLTHIIIGLLSLAVVFLIIDNYVLKDDSVSVTEKTSVTGKTASETTENEETENLGQQNSVAVLPFANLSADPAQEYFADGMTEELLNFLSRVPDLQVTGRTSSFYFKGKNEDLRTIAEKLGVEHIVEGSVRKSGDRVRITAQLINAATGYHLWSNTYDRTLDDIFAIQDDIAKSVADVLEITLGVGALGRVPGMTRNVAAYDEYLLARAASRITPDGVRNKLDHLQRAVALDPDFALAWTRLHYVYGSTRFIIPGGVQDWEEKAKQALDRARVLTPDSPFVLERLAADSVYRGAWLEADGLYRDVVSAATNYSLPFLYGRYGYFLLNVGRVKESLEYFERMRTIDPLNGEYASYLVGAYASLGDSAAALAAADDAIKLEGPQYVSRGTAVTVALATGDRAEIDKRLELLFDIEKRPVNVETRKHMDDPVAASAALRQMAAEPANATAADQAILSFWAAYFGDAKFALDLWRGLAQGDLANRIFYPVWQPIFRDMRRLEGFKDFIHDIGLVDYWRTTGNWGDFCRPLGDDDFECE